MSRAVPGPIRGEDAPALPTVEHVIARIPPIAPRESASP